MINRILSGRYGAYRLAAHSCLAILKRGGFFCLIEALYEQRENKKNPYIVIAGTPSEFEAIPTPVRIMVLCVIAMHTGIYLGCMD